jgi:hypothetical protein
MQQVNKYKKYQKCLGVLFYIIKTKSYFLASRTKSVSVPSVTFNNSLRFSFLDSIAFNESMYCGISAALVPLTNEIVFAYQINLFQYHYHAFLTSLLPIYCNKYRF